MSNKKANANATAVESAKIRAGHVAIERKACEADGAAQDALLNAMEYAMRNGAPTVAELVEAGRGEATAKNYASARTQCAKLAEKIGADRAVKLIRDAKLRQLTGMRSLYDAAMEAVRTALESLKASAVTGKATGAQASAVVKALPQALATRHANRSQKSTETKRGTKSPDTATLATAAIQSGSGARELAAGLRLMANNATRFAEPEGREAAWKAALAKLQDAAEAFAPFLK